MIYRTGDIESLYACAECGSAFVPLRAGQKRCGNKGCLWAYQARCARAKTRAAWESMTVDCVTCGRTVERTSTSQRTCLSTTCKARANWILHKRDDEAHKAVNRERCAKWYAAKRGDGQSLRNPWLLGAPICGAELPGGICDFTIEPSPKWPIDLRNTRALHACMTNVLGISHTKNLADFALVPGAPWRLYVRDSGVLCAVANGRHEAKLFGRGVVVSFGAANPLLTPVVKTRGRRRLTIETLTPVSMRHGVTENGVRVFRSFDAPTSENIASALSGMFLSKLGISMPHERLALNMIGHETKPVTVPIGGKYGDVVAWKGTVALETNAVGEWLLRCATMIGFGGRTAFGFGRIRVVT